MRTADFRNVPTDAFPFNSIARTHTQSTTKKLEKKKKKSRTEKEKKEKETKKRTRRGTRREEFQFHAKRLGGGTGSIQEM